MVIAIVISTHTLRGERDFHFAFSPPPFKYFNSHAPWGAWRWRYRHINIDFFISTHTLRGERDSKSNKTIFQMSISTHTLRGERDLRQKHHYRLRLSFQLTRSVGSVTTINMIMSYCHIISTHTLRGERDQMRNLVVCVLPLFQLTRSVGSVTQK